MSIRFSRARFRTAYCCWTREGMFCVSCRPCQSGTSMLTESCLASEAFWWKSSLQNYPVELLQSMLEIYSPSGSEGQLASFLQEQMSARGFKVRRDHVGSVIGELGEEGPRVLLRGHMDTVPREIPVRIEGDFIYGRGSVDAKSSLAAMIAGSSLAIERSPAPFRVTIAG